MSDWSAPNPDVYLNHLPPSMAHQFEVARNLYLAVLGAAIWDILVYIPDDIKILRQGISSVTFSFIFARVLAVVYVLLTVIVQTHPIAHCQAMELALGILCLLAMSCTSYLFLRRVQAVYQDNRIVYWTFFFFWFGMSVVLVTVPIGTFATHIEGTGYCIIYRVESYVSVSAFLPAIFDTAVFFAISYKIASTHSTRDSGITWDTLVSGKALPRLSRAVLQGGQQYYLIVFGFNILDGIFLYTPSLPPIYRFMIAYPTIALAASMASRVFRNIKKFDEANLSAGLPISTDLNFARGPISEKSSHHANRDPRVQIFSSVIASRGPGRASGDGTAASDPLDLKPQSEHSAETDSTKNGSPSF